MYTIFIFHKRLGILIHQSDVYPDEEILRGEYGLDRDEYYCYEVHY
jgi:hypothetical protein